MRKLYSTKDVARGTKIEMEHRGTIKKFLRKGVGVKTVAKSIAIDHLNEHPEYYRELVKMEKNLKKKK